MYEVTLADFEFGAFQQNRQLNLTKVSRYTIRKLAAFENFPLYDISNQVQKCSAAAFNNMSTVGMQWTPLLYFF